MHTTYSFGDVRLDRRGEIITEQIVAAGSLVLRRFGGGRDRELAAGRFLASRKVTPEAIIDTHAARTQGVAQGRRVVVAQDTTEINFSGRARGRKGLGPAGDGKSPGFFIHAVVAVDADREDLIGVVGAHIWTRPPGKRKRRQMQPVEAKETVRWIDGAERADAVLQDTAQVVTVEDREGDFYARLARVPKGQDAIIRARHNRKLAEGGALFAAADAWPDLGVSEIAVPPRGRGDKGRRAKVAIRANQVTITKPKAKVRTPDPETLDIGLVEVREIDPPAKVKPVTWRLLTTLPTATRGRSGGGEALPPALAHRAGVPGLEERRAGAGGDAGRGGQPPVQAGRAGAGGGGAHSPAGRRARRLRTAGERCDRPCADRAGRRHRQEARRPHGAAEKPACQGLAQLARLDRGPARRLELLL